MMPQYPAVLRDKIARSRHLFSGFSINKGGIIIVRHKADLLTVRLMCHRKSRLLCHGTDLVLGVFSHRHQGMGKLILGQIIQRIGLVLRRRNGIADGETAVWQSVDPRIMSRGNIIRTDL